ncbi:MAG: alpha/beta hydrolase-fold protein [Pirellulales bacterium]
MRFSLAVHLTMACAVAFLVTYGAPEAVAGEGGRLVYITVHSPALEGNLLKDSPDRPVAVYLPPTYDKSPSRRYPAIYLLHGIGDTHKVWTEQPSGEGIAKSMDALVSAKKVHEMIVVMPNERNAYFGSFYSDSAVTGNWETFTAGDLPKYVDAHYRTLPQAASRGVAGHSMGGHGAIKMGMKHPDVFCAVFAMNPAVLGWAADLSPRNPAFVAAAKLKSPGEAMVLGVYPAGIMCVAAAFSPNPDRPPLFIDLPFELRQGELQPVAEAYRKWNDNMPVYMVEKYADNLRKLVALHFDTGVVDEYTHIPPTCAQLSKVLTRNRVPHVYEVYDGDHRNRLWGHKSRIERKMLPYFSANLAFEMTPSAN